jgi:hypothetical protein
MINPPFATAHAAPSGRVIDGAAWRKLDWRGAGVLALFAVGGIAALVLARSHGHGLASFVTEGAVFAGSLVAGTVGFAFAAVTGALLFHFVPPTTALITLGLANMIAGMAVVGIAAKLPASKTNLERWGGRLFAYGFVLAIVAFPLA